MVGGSEPLGASGGGQGEAALPAERGGRPKAERSEGLEPEAERTGQRSEPTQYATGTQRAFATANANTNIGVAYDISVLPFAHVPRANTSEHQEGRAPGGRWGARALPRRQSRGRARGGGNKRRARDGPLM